MSSKLRLAALHRYPVKGCRGVSVGTGRLDDLGLVGDRRWAVVDGEGRFLSQREHPRMALLEAVLAGGFLRLRAPGAGGRDEVSLPAGQDGEGEVVRVRIWRDPCRARDAGEEAARWLEGVLGCPCRLVRVGPEFRRRIDDGGDRVLEGRIGFADGFPLLLATRASLGELNRRLARPVEMIRFRPNLVVEGGVPFAEDRWRRVRIGGTTFLVAGPCRRCSVPNVDPATGVRDGAEPMATLASFRRDGAGHVLFGCNLVHEGVGETLRVGDPVEVLEVSENEGAGR